MTTEMNGHRPVSAEWPAFHERLTETLQEMAEDQYLVIMLKNTNRYVQFSAQGFYGMRAETVCNNDLEAAERLTTEEIALLGVLGWDDPTSGPSLTPDNDPDGSPNYFLEWAPPADYAEIAALAVRTLLEVHDVAHPGWLEYKAFDAEGINILLPELGLKQA